MASNRLEELPSTVEKCSALQVVDLSSNRLTSAAPLASLTALVSVKLGDNALAELPAWDWEKLEHLATLAAPKNKIGEAPAGLGCLGMLAHLDLAENAIVNIPIELCKLTPKKLQSVRLAGNPLADPRIRRFVDDDSPTMVKDLINHVKKHGYKGDGGGGGKKGGGKKGKKGKAKAAKEESEEEDDGDTDVAALLAAMAAGSDDDDE